MQTFLSVSTRAISGEQPGYTVFRIGGNLIRPLTVKQAGWWERINVPYEPRCTQSQCHNSSARHITEPGAVAYGFAQKGALGLKGITESL